MMVRAWLRVAAVAMCLVWILPLVLCAGNDHKPLEQALKAKYQFAETSYDGARVIKEGTALVLQQDGVYANPTHAGG